MPESTSHLRPDGTTFPPVTPDPPAPPGYVDPLEALDLDERPVSSRPDEGETPAAGTSVR